MKAIVYSHYGSPDVLTLEEVAKPVPADTEVLIRVRAASANPLDWHFMRGTPYFLRLMTGLRKPKVPRLGVDVAGVVEAVGRAVTLFQPGDAVFGSCRGSFAEYVSTAESALVLKPDALTFEQAASSPVAGLTALQGLRDKGRIQPGHKVLINGAAGGVGTFAVQIAASLGAEVTGVCSTPNVDMVRSLGAHRVIDYTRADFTQDVHLYDILFDCIGNHSFAACRRVLEPQGVYVGVGGPNEPWYGMLARLFRDLLIALFVSQRLAMMLAKTNQQDLVTLCDLMAEGRLKPVIDRGYPLSDTAEAIRYLETGHARGKVIISVAP